MIDNLMRLISDIVDKKIRVYDRGRPKMWVAQVVTASVAPNAMASVYVNGDTTSVPISVKNKTHETLSSGNQCYLISPSGSLNDCVILYRK